MYELDENYYLRKCFFNREQVPTQSTMKEKMGTPLAKVYFKSMNHNLKVLAGLEPALRGGGADWFVPPEDVLKGRYVLKPVAKKHLSMLGFNGIDAFGETLIAHDHRIRDRQKHRALLHNDNEWKQIITKEAKNKWDETAQEAAMKNTMKLQEACYEFRLLYSGALNTLEAVMRDASGLEVARARAGARRHMAQRYTQLHKEQAIMLYDKYSQRFSREKEERKAEFIRQIEEARTKLDNTVHDINVEKHVAVEKLRNLLECQNLTCQVYVALKEREECQKDMDETKRMHMKKIKILKEQIDLKDFELNLELEKEKKKMEFVNIWKKKVYHIVKRFQMFVSFCLKTLPEHAEFFLNIEKLMMMQLNEAAIDPEAESIFESEPTGYGTPVPRSKPFVVVGDVGYKPQFEEALCPKKVKSTPSHLPVIVINKRCIYSACDNMDRFTETMKSFLNGRRGEDFYVEDDHDYKHSIPVTHTASQQLLELNLEDSIMQILQKNIPNPKDVSTLCCLCKLTHCFCSPLEASKRTETPPKPSPLISPSIFSVSSGKNINRSEELKHEREPKWESYMSYVQPKRCKCAKTAKKHLEEHLPPYMRIMSNYEPPELPNYEPCDVETLKRLVRKARKKPPKIEPQAVESKTREASAQCSDREFDLLCTCFSDDEISKLYRDLVKGTASIAWDDMKLDVVSGPSPPPPDQATSSFATDRAISLRRLLNSSPDLEEIFAKADSVTPFPF